MRRVKTYILAAALLVSLCFVTEVKASGQETIFEGVYIEDVDVSGMTEMEARTAVEAWFAQLGQTNITLHMNGHAFTTNASNLGYTWTNQQVVQEALQYGKRGNVVTRYKQKKALEQNAAALTITGAADAATIQSVLEANCVIFNQAPQDFAISCENGEIVQVPGVPGVELDVATSAAQIESFINTEWQRQEADIDLAVTTIPPGGDEEMLSKITDKLGAGSTDYSSSSKNRKTNVANAVSKIDGTILYPGESFSVLDAVLPFDIDNGYASAASYMQGEVVESVGGGVCQVSSTLYLALIRAELQIDKRSAHSMLVSYVKPGFDAAVAEGSKDLKFTNNTDAPIYIYGTADGSTVAFTVFGMDTREEGREISFKTEYMESSNPTVKSSVVLWKYVTLNGETEKIKINNSTYYKSNKQQEQEKAEEEARKAAEEEEARKAAEEAAQQAAQQQQEQQQQQQQQEQQQQPPQEPAAPVPQTAVPAQ